MKPVYFERAIFLGWYCSKRDCRFCYMSTVKSNKMALRRKDSILAEALICKKMNWLIEFLSAGYNSYDKRDILDIVKGIYKITNKKQWLNIGSLDKRELKEFKPYIEGVSGAVECINMDVRKMVCPSKPLGEIINMFKYCDEIGLKKAITIIIGLGETIDDFSKLKEFIERYKIDKVIFYPLKLHKGSVFKKVPSKEYYLEWVKKTRENFPRLMITAGSWIDRLDEINSLLRYADNITKFPCIRLFNSRYSKIVVKEVEKSGRKFKSNFTNVVDIRYPVLQKYIDRYLKQMRKKC